MVDRADEGVLAGFGGLSEREPTDATVFVGLIVDGGGVIGLKKETTIQMEMGGNELATFVMTTDRDDFEREDFGGEGF